MRVFNICKKGGYMSLGYETNFYIRKDDENVLWSGLSVSIPDKEFNNINLVVI
jgi:hypothetical protein